jgi:predicted metal-dependent phosphoesterase TrpH
VAALHFPSPVLVRRQRLAPFAIVATKAEWPTVSVAGYCGGWRSTGSFTFALDFHPQPNIKTLAPAVPLPGPVAQERKVWITVKIDLHVHSKDCSDGRMTLQEIFEEAHRRDIRFISITDHDSVDCQESARRLAEQHGISYLCGLELNVSFSAPGYRDNRPISLDFLAYGYDPRFAPLIGKLSQLREYRKRRAQQILERINDELVKQNRPRFTEKDMEEIQSSVDGGALGRPHIANYMVNRGIVATKQEAFDKYLVKCNVPKLPLSLSEASRLVKGAGGKIMLAHPNDPNGTSLFPLAPSLVEQQKIIRDHMLPHIDGVECWHPRHNRVTADSYLAFAKEMGLMVTGGSDCHQQPVLMGTVDVPDYVAEQFLGSGLQGVWPHSHPALGI